MSFAGVSLEQALAIGSALIALASFILNLRLVDRQEKRNAVNLKLAYDSDVLGWSDEVITMLSHAIETLCEKGVSYNDAEFHGRRSMARAHLSALIDRGRIFFPNRTDTDHGSEKEMGFQGHRQAVLDVLVEAYAVLDKAGLAPGPDQDAAAKLRAQSRLFVAEIFKTVDPVRRGAKVKELVG